MSEEREFKSVDVQPQEEKTEQPREEKKEPVSGSVQTDNSGTPFNPDLHDVDESGNPKLTKTGKFRKKRKKKSESKSAPKIEGYADPLGGFDQSEYKEDEPINSEGENEYGDTESFHISGKMFLTVLDIVMSNIVVRGYGMIDKRAAKIDINEMRLTKEEKGELTEIADAVSKELLGNTSPMAQFFIGLSAIYADKLFANLPSK